MSTDKLNIPSTVKDPHYRYKMPRIQTTTQGSGNGIKTNWVNLPDVASALKVPLEYPIKFIARELGANTDTKSNSYLINGSHGVEQMQELLDKFIRKYVLCPKCHLPEIHGKIRVGKKNEIKCTCRSCGATSKLDSDHSFASYIKTNPPPYEKDEVVAEDSGAKIGKTEKKPVKIDKKLRNSIKECCLNLPKVLDDKETLEKNIEEIKKFVGKYEFNLDCKFYCLSFGIFPDEIYTQTFLNRLPIIKHFLEKESDNKLEEATYNLIIGFQDKIFSRQKGENQKYVSSVLYYLYDKDIITEEFWLKYLNGNIQEKYNSIFRVEDSEKKLKEAAKEFSKWIETGPYEGEEEDEKKEEKKEEKEEKKEEKDEEDDDDDKGKKKGKKKKGKKKKGKEKEEKDDEKKKKIEKKEEKKEENKEEKKEEKQETKQEVAKEEKQEEKKEEKKEEEDINIDDI